MSLFKQLLIAICLFLIVVFSGSFIVSLETSRSQYVNQLRSHAQDAATALALSLTPNIDDPAMVELMVSSIFDSGYYADIKVINQVTEKVMVERSGIADANSVPGWFVSLIALEPAGGEAIVSRGWEQAARVEVVSHPMFAVAELWQSALGSLGWLLACSAFSALFGAFLLRRQLKPLDYMVEQSQAIARREFLSLPELPHAPELRRVVLAMNLMVEKLKALFQEEVERSEKLRGESYKDTLTGLSNRRYFEMQLHDRLSNPEGVSSGYLLLLRIQDLAGLNNRLGGQRTDQLLQATAEQIVRVCEQHLKARDLICRIRGGEFAILGVGLVRDEAQQLAQHLEDALRSLQDTDASDRVPMAYMGLAPFQHGDSPAAVITQTDQALRQAETQGSQSWVCLEHEMAELGVADDQRIWSQRLDQAFNHQRFTLYFQAVVDVQEPTRVLHYKVMARMVDEQGQVIPAARFLPWIARFGWSPRLDLVIFELVIKQMSIHDQAVAVSLAGATLADPKILNEILELLRQNPALGSRLTLDIGEEQLPGEAVLETLVRTLRELGFGLGVQRFGGRFSLIGNLARLGLAYLKIDGSFIRAIDQQSDKRLFIEAIERATRSIALPLIAERVETAGELTVVRELGLQGAQGRMFSEPAPWQ